MEDFKDLKVGDSVWTIQLGDCEVIDTCNNRKNYPIRLKNSDEIEEDYTLKGFYNENDKYQSLFRSNPFEKKQDFEPRWMMVSSDQKKWHKRFAIAFRCDIYIAWNDAETDEELVNTTLISRWNYAKEIEEIEVTIEQIAEKFGVSIEQIKIKK